MQITTSRHILFYHLADYHHKFPSRDKSRRFAIEPLGRNLIGTSFGSRGPLFSGPESKRSSLCTASVTIVAVRIVGFIFGRFFLFFRRFRSDRVESFVDTRSDRDRTRFDRFGFGAFRYAFGTIYCVIFWTVVFKV